MNVKITNGKEDYKNRIINKLEAVQNDPKNFWKIAKQIYGNKTKNTIPTIIDGAQQHSTPGSKANTLAEYFASQSQRPILPDNYELPDIPELQEEDKLSNIEITEHEVLDVLKQLKLGKSTGPDGISNEILKMSARSITPSLTVHLTEYIMKAFFTR